MEVILSHFFKEVTLQVCSSLDIQTAMERAPYLAEEARQAVDLSYPFHCAATPIP